MSAVTSSALIAPAAPVPKSVLAVSISYSPVPPPAESAKTPVFKPT